MCEFNRFGATLQPLVRSVWQKRVELFRTRQLSIGAAFVEVYAMYSECAEPIGDADVDDFETQLESHAKSAGYKTRPQEDFIFCHRRTVRSRIRIYINTLGLEERLDVAYCLMQVLRDLPQDSCEFKVLRKSDTRADNVVVYVSEDHFSAVKAKILGMTWTGCLRNGVPAGTKKLRDGIGWSEQPGGAYSEYSEGVTAVLEEVNLPPSTISFGGVVSACVVLGLKKTMPEGGSWDEEADKKRYCDAVIQQLELVGTDPLKPHKTIKFDRQIMLAKLVKYYQTNFPTYQLELGKADESTLRTFMREAIDLHRAGELDPQ
jgi:hypothetical protein